MFKRDMSIAMQKYIFKNKQEWIFFAGQITFWRQTVTGDLHTENGLSNE